MTFVPGTRQRQGKEQLVAHQVKLSEPDSRSAAPPLATPRILARKAIDEVDSYIADGTDDTERVWHSIGMAAKYPHVRHDLEIVLEILRLSLVPNSIELLRYVDPDVWDPERTRGGSEAAAGVFLAGRRHGWPTPE